MLSNTRMIYKLIILYFLDSVDFALSNAVISDFILEKGYTDYFNIQTAFNELAQEQLIKSEATLKTTSYIITEDGKKTLDCFHYELSPAIKNEIKEYLNENFNSIVEMLSVSSDYTRIRANEYLVTMKVSERNTLIASVSLTVSGEEAAQACCRNWDEKNSDIYTYLIRQLLK